MPNSARSFARRALGTALAATLFAPALAIATASSAQAETGSQLAQLALTNVGKGPCATNTLGGGTFDGSCSSPTEWCAYFAKWVWENSGIADTGTLSGAASSFYTYGADYGTLHTSSSYTPQVGDAVVFGYNSSNGVANHVALVVAVNTSNDTITTVGGNQSDKVEESGPYGWQVGSNPGSVIGAGDISAYITPVGLTSRFPAGKPAATNTVIVPGGAEQTFDIAPNGNLLTTAQSGPGTGWPAPTNLGGSFIGTPVAAVNAAGIVGVYATGTDGNLYSAWQNSPGGALTALTSLGGGTLASAPTVVLGSGGGYELFAVAANGNLMTSWQTSAGSGWTAWDNLGGSYLPKAPIAIASPSGALSVYMTGTDGNLYTMWQATPGGGLTGPTSLGGGTLASGPTIVAGYSGGFEVFAVAASGNLVTSWQSSAGSGWSGWDDLGGAYADVTPAANVSSAGAIAVYATGTDGNLYTMWQASPGAGLTGPLSLGGGVLTGAPSVVLNSAGAAAAYVTGADGTIYSAWQSAAGSGWSSWLAI